jgi:hypothetical protein
MTPRQTIVCVTKEGVSPHRHVATLAVETASHRWTAAQVRAAIERGARYAMLSPSLRAYVDIAPFDCECGAATLRSFTSDAGDPTLDELEEFAGCPPQETAVS